MKRLTVTLRLLSDDRGCDGVVGPLLRKIAEASGVGDPFIEWNGSSWVIHDSLGNVVGEARLS